MSKRRLAARSALDRAADQCGAAALRGCSVAFQRLPVGFGYGVARVLGKVWYACDARHRAVVEENLCHAFGDEMSSTERQRVARAVFQNITATALEFLMMPRWTYDELLQFVEMCGDDKVAEAITEGKGVILLAAHFGGWELMGGGAGLGGWPLWAVARPLDQPAIGRVVTDIRESTGLKMIQRRGGALTAMRTLRKGKVLGILADQNTRRDNVFVEFFGRPAATTPAPAWLALKTGAPIFPVYLVRTGPRTLRLQVEPKIPLVQTGDFDLDVLLTTQRCAAELERMVRLYPDNWFWVHRRWKTQPPEGWTPPHVPEQETLPAG